MTELPHAVALTGPTAAGKEALGLTLAQRLRRSILVCDSVKVYRRLDIGSAKPSPQTRQRVPHHLLDLVDPDEPFSSGDYASAARRAHAETDGIFVGGTGLYLRATAWSQTSTVPRAELAPDHPERIAFEQRWQQAERDRPGAAWSALNAADPDTAATVHPHNFVRICRALWLCEAHGVPISRVRREDPPREAIRLWLLVLDPGVQAVDRRIADRVGRMLAAGWLDEVEALLRDGYDERHKAMRSLGYRQLVEVVRGRTSLAAARDEIERATRHYARRQRTYMRHQLPAHRVVHLRDPSDCPWSEIEDFVAASPAVRREQPSKGTS